MTNENPREIWLSDGFQEEAFDSYKQQLKDAGYEEGVDFEWTIGRGDDWPNAFTIVNPKLVGHAIVEDMKDFETDCEYGCEDDEDEGRDNW